MRAIMVSVDYHDYLELTLPHNKIHFEDVLIVTSHGDKKTQEIADRYGVKIFTTDSFWDNGAHFNKWIALEQGLDYYGRHGLLCLMDADVIWPEKVPPDSYYQHGCLYSPLRRMLYDPKPFVDNIRYGDLSDELLWKHLPIHRNTTEWAGYTQIFYADDLALGKAPWHEIDWKHAGGADSFFQQKWAANLKVRPPFQVLHLGMPAQNWCGRSTDYIDGTKPNHAAERKSLTAQLFLERFGKSGRDRFASERIDPYRVK